MDSFAAMTRNSFGGFLCVLFVGCGVTNRNSQMPNSEAVVQHCAEGTVSDNGTCVKKETNVVNLDTGKASARSAASNVGTSVSVVQPCTEQGPLPEATTDENNATSKEYREEPFNSRKNGRDPDTLYIRNLLQTYGMSHASYPSLWEGPTRLSLPHFLSGNFGMATVAMVDVKDRVRYVHELKAALSEIYKRFEGVPNVDESTKTRQYEAYMKLAAALGSMASQNPLPLGEAVGQNGRRCPNGYRCNGGTCVLD